MVTGHRPDQLRPEQVCRGVLGISDSIDTFSKEWGGNWSGLCGMARGFDLEFAKVCAELKVPLHAYIPFPQQTSTGSAWSDEDRRGYLDLVNYSTTAQVFGTRPSVQSYHVRNDAMLRDCTHVLAVWDGRERGGTWSVIWKARALDKPITIVEV